MRNVETQIAKSKSQIAVEKFRWGMVISLAHARAKTTRNANQGFENDLLGVGIAIALSILLGLGIATSAIFML